jgi:hypothetical protein
MICIDNIIILSKYLINKIYPLQDNIKYIKYDENNNNNNNIFIIKIINNIKKLFYVKIVQAKGRI